MPLPAADRVLFERVRDYLYHHGPTTVPAVAVACDVSVGAVTRLMREGRLRSVVRPPVECVRCEDLTRIADLCPACRERLASPPTTADPPPADPSPDPAPRAGAFHFRPERD